MRYSNKITDDGNDTCNGNINDQGITKSNANDEKSNEKIREEGMATKPLSAIRVAMAISMSRAQGVIL